MKIRTDLLRHGHKIVFAIVFEQFCSHMLQICANLYKYWNNAMSNDGLIIEIIDESHGD